jgi:hypothetical protein
MQKLYQSSAGRIAWISALTLLALSPTVAVSVGLFRNPRPAPDLSGMCDVAGYCGLQAVREILARDGQKVTLHELTMDLGRPIDSTGTSLQELRGLLAKRGVIARLGTEAITSSKLSTPAIVHLNSSDGRSATGHFVLLVPEGAAGAERTVRILFSPSLGRMLKEHLHKATGACLIVEHGL